MNLVNQKMMLLSDRTSAVLKSPLQKRLSLLVFMFFLLGIGRISLAQTEEEMLVLEMFYKEKDLVVSSTRHAKPISQVAENITVITAKDIERMNAHTVAEILSRVPGVFVNFTQDFGSGGLIHSQGSEPTHVLVLVDGFAWNFLASGSAETNSIPVGIIERIEIIKGPASSAWGSSLGGVVNIITKAAGTTERPAGNLSASYGERNTQDYRGQISGKAASVGYYLYGGFQESDGLKDSRDFDSYNLYSKFHIPVAEKLNLDFTLGYSEPEFNVGDFPTTNLSQTGSSRTFFVTASLQASLSEDLGFELDFHHFKQRVVLQNDLLALRPYPVPGLPGARFLDTIYDEEKSGGNAKLLWTRGRHTVVLGADVDYGKLAQTLKHGRGLQFFYGLPALSSSHPDLDQWALYLNDTLIINQWSFTAGLRYDHNNVTDSFVSPSLGVTYRLNDYNLLRVSIARGFTIPPLTYSSGGGLFLDPNPSLDSEEVWSYQAGMESTLFKYFWLRTTFFRHELDDTLTFVSKGGGPPANNDIYVNGKESRRQGMELELETISFHNFTFLTGLSYVHFTPSSENGQEDVYEITIGIKYDDRKSFYAELFGHYLWWDDDLGPFAAAKYDDFIWDFNVNKNIFARGRTTTSLFLSVHNLFDGSQYTFGDAKNPNRWVEAGVRVNF